MENLIAITTNTIIIIKVEYFWFNLINFLLLFGNFLSKTLVIGVLKRAHTPLKGVLKECHSIFNAGVGAGVPLKKKKECCTRCMICDAK